MARTVGVDEHLYMPEPPKANRERYTTYGATRAVRWADCDYQGDVDIHLTICAARGKPFTDETFAAGVCQDVEFYSTRLAYRLYGFCLMPDHLHVLLSPGESATPVSKWLGSFKSFTTNRFMKAGGQVPLWQLSAHDHVCRVGETAENVLRYIVNNPVRAGLAEDWRSWPWARVFIEV